MAKKSEEVPGVPSVTMANTKKELFAAYRAAREALDKQETQILSAEKAREKAEGETAAAKADAQTSGDPVRRLHDLRADIGRRLNGLAEMLEEELLTYEQVKRAVAGKQAELKGLYGVEAEAADLAALIEAQRTRKETFEAEMAQQKADAEADLDARKAALEATIAETRQQWERERTQHETEQTDAEAQTARLRQREEEEYTYVLEREREQKRNALQDELAALERDVAVKRAAFEEETAAREAVLSQREADVAAREQVVDSLQAQVDAFPAEQQSAVEAVAADTTARLESEAAHRETLLRAQFDGEKNVLLSRIDALEARAASQEAQLSALAEKQDRAYEKVQDIASKAVDSARREVITMPGARSGDADSAS